jgi:hypothetical protein
MNETVIDQALAETEQVARAVLFEGYLLYPYRRSALKNHHRWNFGVLFPPAWCESRDTGDACMMQTQCLLEGDFETVISTKVQFLHDTCSSAVEREIVFDGLRLGGLLEQSAEKAFAFSNLMGLVQVSATAVTGTVFQLTVQIWNQSHFEGSDRDDALRISLVSTQTLIALHDGSFYSMIDPPEHLVTARDCCRNIGAWPVLIGDEGRRDRMFSAPIVLYDYPKVAPQSPGDLFDNTEIDEILSLRIRTLTEEEKREVASTDERARHLLAQIEALSANQLQDLHGTVRNAGSNGTAIGPGDRVRLKPSRRADIFDVALAGRTATVCSIEEDFESNVYACVTIDDDPGKDLGREGKPGHRFFFGLDELEKI